MKTRSGLILAAGLGVIALTGMILDYAKTHQRLGDPGVEVSNSPIYGEHGQICATKSVSLPERVGDLASKPSQITDKELDWLPKDTTFGRRIYFYPDGYWAEASAVLMGRDRTSIHKPEYCLTGQGWTIDRQETDEIPILGDHPGLLKVRKFSVHIKGKDANGKELAYSGFYVFWFVADRLVTDSHWKRLGWQFRDLLLHGVLDRWAYISFFRPCLPGTEKADYERLRSMIAQTVPKLMKPDILAAAPTKVTARSE